LLIVDDDPALLKALPETIELRLGHVRIDTCDSAQAALNHMAEHDYDAIITDIKMPGMDGLALLEKIRQICPDTPTLLITGHGDHDLAIQALRGGAYDFIQKPIERDYFIASLERAIQMRQLRRQVERQRVALEEHAAELERAVAERTRELQQANSVKENFLSIASHELRTPLTSLKGLAQLTYRRLERQGLQEAVYVERMERAIRRMEGLISDLLDVSRIGAGKLSFHIESHDLAEICRQVVEEQRAATGRAIEFQAPEQPTTAPLDADRISQVLTNLISNALKFSPPEQPVVVSLERRAGAHGEELLLMVRDNGCGIPEDRLPYIFERFYQGGENTEEDPSATPEQAYKAGLGLGLFISREIVARHGGHLWAESQLGQGSTFSVALPIIQDEEDVLIGSPASSGGNWLFPAKAQS
jgi:signal transduction histidine kinase